MSDEDVALKNNLLSDYFANLRFSPMIAMQNENNSPPVVGRERLNLSHEDKYGDQQKQQQQQQQQPSHQQQQQLPQMPSPPRQQQQQNQIQTQQQQLLTQSPPQPQQQLPIASQQQQPHQQSLIQRPSQQHQPQQQQMLLSDLFDAAPVWDRNLAPGSSRGGRTSSENSSLTDNSFSMGASSAPRGAVGSVESPNGMDFFTPPSGESSPLSGGSMSRSSITCSWCIVNAVARCLDCNELICTDCVMHHRRTPHFVNHTLVALAKDPMPFMHTTECDVHKEVFRFVCETCRRLVCQYCTFNDHQEHICVQLSVYAERAMEKIEAALDGFSFGTKCVKSSIDKCLIVSRGLDRDSNEVIQNVRKSFRQTIAALEEREAYLIKLIEQSRTQRQEALGEKAAGLRAALSGLAQNSDVLIKTADHLTRFEPMEIAQIITRAHWQLEQFAINFEKLQPVQLFFGFVPPPSSAMHELRNQGDVIISDTKIPPTTNGAVAANMATSGRRSIVRLSRNASPLPQYRQMENALSLGIQQVLSTPRTSVIPLTARMGQSIPGSYEKVVVKKALIPTNSFATEGHEDGQVSRPWGICTDRDGQIFLSDRRNNRIQVFGADGRLRFKFGTKGVGNGQFDLPAGICIDCDNRVIVVDKDNHRVQIFTNSGRFLMKFGCFGREYGQFQYPWDIAVNSRRQIVVTDSRNHRIQMFDSEGHFMRCFLFDNYNHSKGPVSPRGVTFSPSGDVIVSDFDNHCLMLLDSDLQQILASKGHEGTGIQEFNRPSGICCDDDGNIIVADSKNQRVVVYTETLEYLWTIELRPSLNPHFSTTLDEKDRPCDVAVLPDGRVVIMVELSPDCRDNANPTKRFVQVY